MTARGAWTAAVEMRMMAPRSALVAQLDRVLPSEGRGRGFESRRVRHLPFRPFRLWNHSSPEPICTVHATLRGALLRMQAGRGKVL